VIQRQVDVVKGWGGECQADVRVRLAS